MILLLSHEPPQEENLPVARLIPQDFLIKGLGSGQFPGLVQLPGLDQSFGDCPHRQVAPS